MKSKEEKAVYATKYRKEHKDNINARRRERRRSLKPIHRYREGSNGTAKDHKNETFQKNRKRFFEMYGHSCECCGEREEVFLALDHIKGQVGQKRQHSSAAYQTAIQEYRPDLFRVLCHNCNMATRYGRVCPHQRKAVNYEN